MIARRGHGSAGAGQRRRASTSADNAQGDEEFHWHHAPRQVAEEPSHFVFGAIAAPGVGGGGVGGRMGGASWRGVGGGGGECGLWTVKFTLRT